MGFEAGPKIRKETRRPWPRTFFDFFGKVVVPRNTQQHHPNNPKLYTDDVPTHTSRCAA